MNAADPSRPGSGRDEAEELARLLPAPAEFALPPGRHLHHKDALMQQIDHDRNQATAPAAEPPRRRLLLRPAVLLPATALALAGALITTFSAGGHTAPPAAAGRADSEAVVTLNRIAAASMKTDAQPVKNSQFVYTRRTVINNEGTLEGPVKLGAPHRSEVWLSQDPTAVTNIGWMRETGKGVSMSGEDVPIETSAVDGSNDTGALPPGMSRPTYAWLASLPTNPDTLLTLLYTKTKTAGDESKDQAVFSTVGDLLSQTIMPPANAAALYKAVASIPGVTEIPDARDAVGRHGIGITREDAHSATRDEWIFDKHSLVYLGSRSYISKDRKGKLGGKADTLYGSDAVMQHAVVDQHGMEPEQSAG
ncbi:CU044_5270 family protein [Streptomyces sp. NBC_00344]|uniref:CU044_5270 family protein n=1 Tax=Streptomyces sp. NBC_00344 TaxID=2975720 RepID=UPI002E1BF7F3